MDGDFVEAVANLVERLREVAPSANEDMDVIREAAAALTALAEENASLAYAFERLSSDFASLREDRELLGFIANECGGEGQLIWRWWSGPNEHTETICEGVDGQDLRAALRAARGER